MSDKMFWKVTEFAVGIFGYSFIWAAIAISDGHVELFSKTGLCVLVGGMLLDQTGKMGLRNKEKFG